jgi:hypothetical protein
LACSVDGALCLFARDERSLALELMKRDIVEVRYGETLAELNEARADAMAVLGREVAESHARYVQAVDSRDGQEGRKRHLVAREQFLALRWKLTVQREAVGLTEHSWVDDTYPLAALDRRTDEPTEAQRRQVHHRLLR